MLSPQLLDVLRAWWRQCRSQGWLFPGRDPILPITTRSSTAPVTWPLTLPGLAPGSLRIRCGTASQRICWRAILTCASSGSARACRARHHRTLCPGCHQSAAKRHQPARPSDLDKGSAATGVTRGGHGPAIAGGRGYLPRPWSGMAASQWRPCQPRPAQGDEGDRGLPHGGARRPCRALRGLWLHDHCLQQLPQPALSEVPGRGSKRMAGGARGRAFAGALLPRRLHAAERDRRHRLQNKAVIYDLLFKVAAETLLTIAADPKHLGARNAAVDARASWT